MKKIPLDKMPAPKKIRTYFSHGGSVYSSRNVVENEEYLTALPQPDFMLHCMAVIHQKILPYCHHMRIKQRFLTIVLIEEGSQYIRIDQQAFIAEPNDIILQHPGHNIEFVTGPEGYCKKSAVIIVGKDVEFIIKQAGLENINFLRISEPAKFQSALERMKKVLRNPEQNSGICFEILQLLSVPADYICEPVALEELRKYIENNITKDLNVPLLASQIGVSVSQLGKLTKKFWQCSPHQYIRDRRMSLARNLLGAKRFLVKEVSYMVGYNNVFNFSTEFKRIHGVSPKQYNYEVPLK